MPRSQAYSIGCAYANACCIAYACQIMPRGKWAWHGMLWVSLANIKLALVQHLVKLVFAVIECEVIKSTYKYKHSNFVKVVITTYNSLNRISI